jgi:hypothetical protein
MSYLWLFGDKHFAVLGEWLKESGELYVDFEYHHSGGSNYPWFVSSLPDFKDLISRQTWPEIEIVIFRELQFPIRGAVDDAFAQKVLHSIPDGTWYTMVLLEKMYYPHKFSCIGSGNSHSELRKELGEANGLRVAVGTDPLDLGVARAWARRREKVMYFSVSKNYWDSSQPLKVMELPDARLT